ncbi:hypothetical protein E2C01_024399 [Portunus trituberculatus]|uniref:Uncharacterized protein n=1 Tax=Portunus trituberculatus TaxID=210409 RepID=A0A5B7EA90_PORTR|nr:hypothetical protein [Portunus trituberculatus]
MKGLSPRATPASQEKPRSQHLPGSKAAKRRALCRKIHLEAADTGTR